MQRFQITDKYKYQNLIQHKPKAFALHQYTKLNKKHTLSFLQNSQKMVKFSKPKSRRKMCTSKTSKNKKSKPSYKKKSISSSSGTGRTGRKYFIRRSCNFTYKHSKRNKDFPGELIKATDKEIIGPSMCSDFFFWNH